jgi:hypothetical protein
MLEQTPPFASHCAASCIPRGISQQAFYATFVDEPGARYIPGNITCNQVSIIEYCRVVIEFNKAVVEKDFRSGRMDDENAPTISAGLKLSVSAR